MKNLNLSRSFVDAQNGPRAAFILGVFLTLFLIPVSSNAQTTPPEQTTTTTSAVANAARDVAPAKSVVRGRVIYDDTNRPVRRTRVMLLELTNAGPERGAMTNASGEFQFKDVPAGKYVVMVDATGVITPLSLMDIDDKAEKFDAEEVKKYFDEVIVDGNRDVAVKVRAKRGGAISGKVTYSDGDLAVNVRVTVIRKTSGRLTRFITNMNPTALFGIQTDDRGMYRVAGLAPGEYIVSVSETVDHEGQSGRQRGDYMDMLGSNSLVVTYYKDVTKSSDASVVKIDLGQDQNEINITLADRVLHIISGTVVARNGSAPIGNATISVTSKDNAGAGSTFMMPTNVSTDADGLFAFNEMPDGEYTLTVEPPYTTEHVVDTEDEDPNSPPPPLSAPSPKLKFARKQHEVTVSGSDVTDLTIKLSEGANVSGLVTVEGATAIPPDTFVQLETASHESVAEGKRVLSDGRFLIDGVSPGAFYTNVRLPLGSQYYVRSMSVNGIDLMSDPLVVGENADVNDVRIVVSGDGATLSGRVLSGNNTPISGVQLTLVPADPRKWRARASYLFGASGNDGSYSISGAPGDYLIIFLRDVDQPIAINETWIRDRSATAEHVSLLPSERKNLDLTIP